jgi:hypothetical protein
VVEGRVLDRVAVDFADVEVFFHLGDVDGWDAVGCAPDSWRCGCMLEKVFLLDLTTNRSASRGVGRCLTWSVSVSQSCLSMSVTTRPGSSGVPR